MNNNYKAPSIELIQVSTEDIISTSPAIDLPLFPFEEGEKEI